jgi:hypothetical protein
MPQANSTTSMPRVIEPLESATVLPCSSVKTAASSSMFASISDFSRNMTRARRSGGVAAQAGNAAFAASTAWRTSAALAKATWRMTSPMAGL